ncbi:MAG: S8 family serine peptidase [Planctomycetota bacterium]
MMGFKKFLYRRLPTGQGVGVLAVTTAALLSAGPASANLDAAYTTNAYALWQQGLTGEGVTVGVWESTHGGSWTVRDTHKSFQSYNPATGLYDGPSRVTFGDDATGENPDNHASQVAGTIGASHLPDEPYSWGMAPSVQIVSYRGAASWFDLTNATVDISNHSYNYNVGDTPSQYGYNQISASLDGALFNAPKHLAFWSAGNANNDYYTLDSYASPKNNVTIGNVYDIREPDPNLDVRSDIRTVGWASSYGPTSDGRLGVDLVANGHDVLTPGGGHDADYDVVTGTSLSSPNAAGTAALVLEHWRNQNGGYTPDSATQKGLLMHTATDATRYGLGPDYATGYGLVNGYEAVEHITESTDEPLATRDRHIWEGTLNEGEAFSLQFLTTGTGSGFKASLSWLDPAGSVGDVDDQTPKLVNDLDIMVTTDYANIYPWVLDPDDPDADAAQHDYYVQNRVDNFTQVSLPAPADRIYSVNITHHGALTGGSQDYALFVTGGVLVNGTPLSLTPVPEPGSLALLAAGGLFVLRRRRG